MMNVQIWLDVNDMTLGKYEDNIMQELIIDVIKNRRIFDGNAYALTDYLMRTCVRSINGTGEAQTEIIRKYLFDTFKKMQKDGYLNITGNSRSKRNQYLELTEKGLERYREVFE